jgi:two-component system response regulator WspF
MRIGIVNGSATACEVLRRVLLSVAGPEIAWITNDGGRAIALAQTDPPDIIVMDLDMPGFDGIEATRRIMSEHPCAILVVTASVSGHISKVYQAMGYGALDAVDTPVLKTNGEVSGAASLLRKIDVIGRLIGKTSTHATASSAKAPGFRPGAGPPFPPLVLLGCSTGGPFALAEILAELPGSPKATVIIVQHVDATFAPGLGQWLGEHARRKVELVTEGSPVVAGKVLLSGTNDHLVLSASRRLHYSGEPRNLSYRPSIDVFFKSVACYWPTPGVAAVLTGMGRDGAEGLLELRRMGWKTIAQDESTSVIGSMPRTAVELGAADLVLPLSKIAPAIVSLLTGQSPVQLPTSPRTFKSAPSGVLE